CLLMVNLLPPGQVPKQQFIAFFNQVDGLTITDKTMNNAEFAEDYWNEAEIVVRSSHWTLDAVPVSKYNNGSFTMGEEPTYGLEAGFGYFLQNHPQTLDLEGEWCYYNNKIYLKTASDPNAKNVKVSSRYAAIFGLMAGYTVEGIDFTVLTTTPLKVALAA
ncbi:MAG: hypothetical protein HC896_03415, partial [Bacteroidales bacterium]|nr:hypothetical protein [Bacteroidales bacterium]